jgi:hypothetical protein
MDETESSRAGNACQGRVEGTRDSGLGCGSSDISRIAFQQGRGALPQGGNGEEVPGHGDVAGRARKRGCSVSGADDDGGDSKRAACIERVVDLFAHERAQDVAMSRSVASTRGAAVDGSMSTGRDSAVPISCSGQGTGLCLDASVLDSGEGVWESPEVLIALRQLLLSRIDVAEYSLAVALRASARGYRSAPVTSIFETDC